VSESLRLLLVIDSLGSGGAQRQMVNLALGLQSRGHHVEIFYYWPVNFFVQMLEDAHIPVHLHAKSSRAPFKIARALRQVIRRGHYDVTLSFLDGPNLNLLLATRGMRAKPKIIVSERSYDPPEGVSLRLRLQRQLYRLADHVTANSHHQRENLEHRLPWLKGRTSTIFNGVDLTRFYPSDEQRPAVPPLRLLIVASISPCKNGLCLIQALDILGKEYGLHPHVAWAGAHFPRGPRGEYIAQMNRAIDELHLGDQWQWLYERDDIPELMRTHHALVHPSFGEGLPNVVCEALACGLPVIISRTLDHPRLVQHGVSGYLFDWRDPRDLAQAIKAFHDLTDDQRAAMGRQGRAFAEQYLALSVFVDQFEQLFLSLVHR